MCTFQLVAINCPSGDLQGQGQGLLHLKGNSAISRETKQNLTETQLYFISIVNIILTSLKLHESPTHQIAVCYLNSAMMSWISVDPATPVLLTY